ncbi:uncharacterized protein LOC135214105 [Macrobrachium nipponense]|uniref:uncharacterized protein LOC135214105 n=1 Tax=Macrobrachium nipponense TaxID=159736 RepID=UPI0030C894FD
MKGDGANEPFPRRAFADIKEAHENSPTMEKFFPLLFILLAAVGINTAKRGPLGEYHVAKWRFIPLLCLTALIVWYFMQTLVYLSSGKVKLIVIVVYLNFMSSAVFVFAVILITAWKRNDYCTLLTDIVLPYHKPKAQTLGLNILLLAYIAISFYFYPWEDYRKDPLQVALGIIAVLVMPVLPTLIDLQACCLISGLVDGHKDLVRNIQETPIVLPSDREKSHVEKTKHGIMINVLPFLGLDRIDPATKGSSWVEPDTGAIRVQIVRDHCRYLHDLVTKYNHIFSSVMALRCFLFLIKNMALTFAVLVGYPGGPIKFHLIEETLRFYMVCSFGDNLFQLHEDVEDGVLALQESNNTYEGDRLLYHALASRMSARPAFVSIGGTVSLGRGMMAAFLNVALTYTIIMFQYKPSD